MDNKIAIIIWPDGDWMEYEDYREGSYFYEAKSDDFIKGYVPPEASYDDISAFALYYVQDHRTVSDCVDWWLHRLSS